MNCFNKLLEKNDRILIFGKYGQLASTYNQYLGSSPNVLQLSSKEVNFLNPQIIPKIIKEFRPRYIINTSAYTDVNGAEVDIKTAHAINCNAVKIIADCAESYNSIFIHYSTDYVFDGAKPSRYKSTDKANPQNIYGISKFKGENKILESGCDFFILRVSWLVSEFGNNFIKKILSNLNQNSDLSVVNDQVGSPISSYLVAELTALILLYKARPKKILHLSTKGKVTWYDIAIYISQIAQNINKTLKINPIKSSDYPSKTFRPINSLFDLSGIQKITRKELPFWKDDIRSVIKKIDQNFNND
jgi:dTDP-4-dehydrorhamnose reductase